jgi:hypothetical protein
MAIVIDKFLNCFHLSLKGFQILPPNNGCVYIIADLSEACSEAALSTGRLYKCLTARACKRLTTKDLA